MGVAICYDRVNKFGGAERVLLALHEAFPEAPLFTLTYTPDSASWASGFVVHTSFLQKIPFLGSRHELFPPLAQIAWEQFNFRDFEVVISVTSEAAKSIIVPPGCIHICYCLTPTRYLWSGYFEYVRNPGFGVFSFFVAFLLKFWATFLRVTDFFAGQRPDKFISISAEVQKRIRHYYRRESEIVYPPVDNLSEDGVVSERILNTVRHYERGYFLVVSRLVPYKRVDIAVEVCKKLNLPLLVVGEGSQRSKLEAEANGSDITFVGAVSDAELAYLYKRCIACIFCADEDFGIVPVEAQMFGKPVIAYRKGGALETIVENKTGGFFEEQSAESLEKLFLAICGDKEDLLSKLKDYFSQYSSEECKMNARRFAKGVFIQEMQRIVYSYKSSSRRR